MPCKIKPNHRFVSCISYLPEHNENTTGINYLVTAFSGFYTSTHNTELLSIMN